MTLYYEDEKNDFLYVPNEESLKLAVDYVLTFKTKEELKEIIKVALNGNFEPLRADLTEYFEKEARRENK